MRTKIKTYEVNATIHALFTSARNLSEDAMNKIAEDIQGDVNAAIDRALKENECLHDDE